MQNIHEHMPHMHAPPQIKLSMVQSSTGEMETGASLGLASSPHSLLVELQDRERPLSQKLKWVIPEE